MKKIKIHLFSFISIFLIAQYSHAETLCQINEVTLFACRIQKTSKTVSLCRSKNEFYYLYGEKSKEPELKIKFNEKYKIYFWEDLANYNKNYGFNVGQYSYNIIKPQETYQTTPFFIIKRNNKEVAIKNCDLKTFQSTDSENKRLTTVPDSYIRASDFVFPPTAYSSKSTNNDHLEKKYLFNGKSCEIVTQKILSNLSSCHKTPNYQETECFITKNNQKIVRNIYDTKATCNETQKEIENNIEGGL